MEEKHKASGVFKNSVVLTTFPGGGQGHESSVAQPGEMISNETRTDKLNRLDIFITFPRHFLKYQRLLNALIG